MALILKNFLPSDIIDYCIIPYLNYDKEHYRLILNNSLKDIMCIVELAHEYHKSMFFQLCPICCKHPDKYNHLVLLRTECKDNIPDSLRWVCEKCHTGRINYFFKNSYCVKYVVPQIFYDIKYF